jgi:hypothetical protein
VVDGVGNGRGDAGHGDLTYAACADERINVRIALVYWPEQRRELFFTTDLR